MAGGAPILILVSIPLQPPDALAVDNQVANCILTAACACPPLTVVVVGQVRTTGGAEATVNVAWHVVVNGVQLLLYVNITVVEPPHAGGAPMLLLVKTPLHPPDADALANQELNAASMAVCVWHAATVVLVGQVKITGVLSCQT